MTGTLRAMAGQIRKLPKRARDQVSKLPFAGFVGGDTSETIARDEEGSREVGPLENAPEIGVVRHHGAWGLAVGSRGVYRHFPTQDSAIDLALDLGERKGQRVVIHVPGGHLRDRPGSRHRSIHLIPTGETWGLRLGTSGPADRLFADRSAALREAQAWGHSEHRRIVVHPPADD